MTFLKDPDDQVRRNVITSLTALGNRRCLSSLVDHFHYNRRDKVFILTAIGKIGGAEAIDFLLNLLSEEEPGIRRLPSRQKEEIKIAALNTLGKIGSAISSQIEIAKLKNEVKRLIAQRKKGIKGLFVKDPVAETAERLLKAMEGNTHSHISSAATGEK